MHLNNIAPILKHIGEENRLLVICLLFSAKKMCVTDIANHLCLSVAVTSHHLKVLEKNNVLRSSRNGKEIFYEISPSPVMKDIKKLICKYAS